MENVKCAECGKLIEKDKNYAQCSVIGTCKKHFECAGIKETTWLKQGVVRRETWICSTHKSIKTSKEGNASNSSLINPSVSTEITETKKVSDSAATPRQLNKDMSEIADLKKFFSECMKTIENKIDLLNQKFDKQAKELEEIKAENKKLKEDNEALQEEVATLRVEVNQLDTYTRRKNLVVRGVRETKEESVIDIVKNLGEALGIKLEGDDIENTFRIPTRKSTIAKPILVKLKNEKLRDRFIAEARKKRPTEEEIIEGGNQQTAVFCEEHIGQGTKQILNHCLQAKKVGELHQVWITSGRTCVRFSPGGNANKINSISHLDLLLADKRRDNGDQ
ncbi:hypothetical protein GE061_002839 [Apolygus lucorum]|uniref:Zinc finger PHD-type domain-containing protein n=1 Tax=Apolygus lucorum TaxID=248454 RepID=A0A6A4JM30_APOLU|nr:hypothetical protein GE061_002839 [Apolygus lucorum]